MAQLFEYAVILQEKRDKEGEIKEEAKVLVEPTTVLADDAKQAGVIAARAIPATEIKKIARIEVIVRPF